MTEETEIKTDTLADADNIVRYGERDSTLTEAILLQLCNPSSTTSFSVVRLDWDKKALDKTFRRLSWRERFWYIIVYGGARFLGGFAVWITGIVVAFCNSIRLYLSWIKICEEMIFSWNSLKRNLENWTIVNTVQQNGLVPDLSSSLSVTLIEVLLDSFT